MLIQGSAVSGKTDYLINSYINLLNKGTDASKILVLCLNSYKKSLFLKAILKDLCIAHYENPKIYTFSGLVYNTIINFWPLIESGIKTGSPVVTPNLSGLEISQIFFKSAIKEAGFKDYNSKINLLHQLFRRYSLIMNNNLSEKEIEQRSKLLGEQFAPDAQKAIDIYKKKTLEFRAFDYIRQLGLFEYIYKNTNCFKNIEYLILDDADEITPFEFEFIKAIKQNLKEVYIGYDRNGASRIGFLNADVNTPENIEKLFNHDKKIDLDNPETKINNIYGYSYTRRLEMVHEALKQISELISSGINPGEISIITPQIDKSLKFAISEAFDLKNIDYQYFSGSEKLASVPVVKNILYLLDLAAGSSVDTAKARSIFSDILKIPLKYCIKHVRLFKERGAFEYTDLGIDIYNERLESLIKVLDKIKSPDMLLSDKIFYIYNNLINIEQNEIKQLSALNFFIKQIEDFEAVFKEHKFNPAFQKSFLTQLENSIISENPSSAPEIKENAIIIGTAQKIIDYSYKTEYQFWLDVSSDEWTKNDFGMLYNAWAFQKSWNKKDFTYEDNLELSDLKTKKQLRKLSLLCTEKIYAYSSLFDIEGNENFKGIEDYIIPGNRTEDKKIEFFFTPREDQKPVLEYKKGKLSISAVPGAGKTTILLALIIKLIQSGVKSENIFVLTFMDSAARNFKERIKSACPSIEKLPNISTIHGLALRILKENSNFLKAGLNEDFEVCDDNQRQKIIREIMYKMQFDQEDYDKYERAISALKLSDIKQIPFVKDNEIKKFLKFYTSYNQYLKSLNLIDYDDMLCYCVNILDENKDIANYYQSLCHYLIEDEAQDSSSIQQKLLNILSKKHNNLIRCGDINQAITTTFTNSDLEGFKEFIKSSKNVTMNHSQRCAKGIYSLANKLIDYSFTNDCLKNSFFNIKMHGVTGKNPKSKDSVFANIFDDYKQEREFMLEQIRSIFSANPNATISILVRNNYNISEFEEFLSDYGYSVITKNDTLNSQPVFSLVYSILKFCSHPLQNDNVLKIIEVLTKQRLCCFSKDDKDFITNLKTPFILLTEQNIPSKKLIQLLWDLNYWLENSTPDIEEFAIKTGCYYYSSEIEKSNVYMVALMLKKLYAQYKDTDILLERLEDLARKPILSKFKFFNDEEKNPQNNGGKIQIMTYHKSKGDEFDYVFIPQLCEEILPLEMSNIKIKSKERFIESVKGLKSNYNKKNEKDLKLAAAEENMRLLYVALTRAKQKLYITSAHKYKKYSKLKDVKPSVIFEKILIHSAGSKNE